MVRSTRTELSPSGRFRRRVCVFPYAACPTHGTDRIFGDARSLHPLPIPMYCTPSPMQCTCARRKGTGRQQQQQQHWRTGRSCCCGGLIVLRGPWPGSVLGPGLRNGRVSKQIAPGLLLRSCSYPWLSWILNGSGRAQFAPQGPLACPDVEMKWGLVNSVWFGRQ